MIHPRRAGLTLALAIAAGSGGAWAVRPGSPRAMPADRDGAAQTEVEPSRESGGHAISLGRVVQDGLQIDCRVTPMNPPGSVEVREGQDVRFEFSIADKAGGTPVAKAYPSAWVVARPEGAAPTTPRQSARLVATLNQGGLFNRPEIDLNVFYVVTLNHNATLSVVDPRFGFGGTKLLALVTLNARGDDWVLGPGGRQLFVAMPDTNQVAVVDTLKWSVTANLPGGVRPHRIALQPDGRRLWVAGGAEGGADSGVTVLDPDGGKILARIRTGPGRHDLAFSDDSRHAFVTNADEGTVSIVDTEGLREEAPIRTGRRPESIAYSTRSKLAYVTDPLDGTVVAVDPATRRIAARVEVGAGIGAIRFSPDGRAGFLVNPSRNTVSVLDPSTDRVVQTAKVEEGPDRVTFTDEFAYVRHRGSVSVVMIGLESAGREGAALSVVPFPAGEKPPGAMDDPTPADSIVVAPGGGAVLIANPSDRSVYYYKQGLSAPMGTFSNYKRAPRAALVLDRSLRERGRPGTYEATVRLENPGAFDVVLFLDQPRVTLAFPVDVRIDPERERARNVGKVDVRPLMAISRVPAGRSFRPLFEFVGRSDGAVKVGVDDVEFLLYRVGGGWQDRRTAREFAPGIYGADFRPDVPGIFHLALACESLGLSLNDRENLTVRVDDPSEGAPPPGLQNHAEDQGPPPIGRPD